MTGTFRTARGVVGGLLLSCATLSLPAAAAADEIRLGWQTPWATQGQLVMGLIYSNIPELTDLELDYIGFSYGGPLNQAALAGQVDVLLTADQPAIALMSRSDDYKIVARMMYNRICVYVPPESEIVEITDLASRHIAGPVGAAAERVTLEVLSHAGVALDSIRFGNLDMGQQTALIANGARDGRWGSFDALYGFDPLPAVYESQGVARMIHCGIVVSVVMASREMIEERRAELEDFLTAFTLSWQLFASNPEAMNDRFIAHSELGFSSEALEIAAAVEPNRAAASPDEIRLTFSDADFEIIEGASAFLVSRDIIKAPLNPRDPTYLDLAPLEGVRASGRVETLLGEVRLDP